MFTQLLNKRGDVRVRFLLTLGLLGCLSWMAFAFFFGLLLMPFVRCVRRARLSLTSRQKPRRASWKETARVPILSKREKASR